MAMSAEPTRGLGHPPVPPLCSANAAGHWATTGAFCANSAPVLTEEDGLITVHVCQSPTQSPTACHSALELTEEDGLITLHVLDDGDVTSVIDSLGSSSMPQTHAAKTWPGTNGGGTRQAEKDMRTEKVGLFSKLKKSMFKMKAERDNTTQPPKVRPTRDVDAMVVYPPGFAGKNCPHGNDTCMGHLYQQLIAEQKQTSHQKLMAKQKQPVHQQLLADPWLPMPNTQQTQVSSSLSFTPSAPSRGRSMSLDTQKRLHRAQQQREEQLPFTPQSVASPPSRVHSMFPLTELQKTGSLSGSFPQPQSSTDSSPASTGPSIVSPGTMMLSLAVGELQAGDASSSRPPIGASYISGPSYFSCPVMHACTLPPLALAGRAASTQGPIPDCLANMSVRAPTEKPGVQTLIGVAPGTSPAVVEAYLKAKAAQRRRSNRHLVKVVELS